jgi:hypothetical protein
MRVLRRLFQRQDVSVILPPPTVPTHDRNELEWLKAYDRELAMRLRALELDASVITRRSQEDH